MAGATHGASVMGRLSWSYIINDDSELDGIFASDAIVIQIVLAHGPLVYYSY
jgi:hypothetical protein